MAMTMSGEVALPADRMTVWTALNDPEVLKRCIPGCQELQKLSDTELQATVRAAVGPVKATFKGPRHADGPRSAERLPHLASKARAARLGSPRAAPGPPRRRRGRRHAHGYDVEAHVGGKIAQIGCRLINGAAKKFADELFANFAKVLAGEDMK